MPTRNVGAMMVREPYDIGRDRELANRLNPHYYNIQERAWVCFNCNTDCGRDDLPCSCCFDDIPTVEPRRD